MHKSQLKILKVISNMAADSCVLTLLLVSTLMVLSNVNASDSASSKDLELADLLPEGLVCPGNYDVVVMLDRSSEVSREEFTKYTDFIKDKLIHLFGVEEGGSHFGLVYYNDNPQIAMTLNEDNNATFIKNYLMTSLPRRQGDRNLQKALRETRSQLLTEEMGDRSEAPNICLLFTTEDGAWVKRNKQFPKINEVCHRFVRWRSGDYNNRQKVLERLCPVSAEEAQRNTRCPLPFVPVEKYCFHTTLTKLTFVEASELCKVKNGYLAQINSAEKNAAFKEYLSSLMIDEDRGVWIGLTDMTGFNLNWRWIVDNSELKYSNWRVNQPDSNTDNCAVALTLGRFLGLWEDEDCTNKTRGVCEINPIQL